MSEISKQALKVDNSTSFPNNTTGYISPTILRAFNVNMIDSLVDEIGYTADSASWNVSIGALNTFTASQQPSFTALNSFTASQLTINTGVNLFTQSADNSIVRINAVTASYENFASSINQIIVNGASIGTSTRFFFNGFVSASIIPNVDGAIADITVLSDPSKLNSSSFNAYTASTAATQSVFSASVATSISSSNATFNAFSQSQNSFNLSATASLVELLNLSSSLSGGYATQGELDYSSSVLQANIDTKANSASFNSFTASQFVSNSYFATTGSNQFVGVQTINNVAGTDVGEVYLLSDSGSLVIGNSTATPTYSALSHISSSVANANTNLIFKTSTTAADTIISGSANIFTNPLAATSGFKRYLTSGNISLTGGLPQISGSMQFSPTITANYLAGTLTMRGPVSSSAWTITSNNILGTINIGNTAVNNAEKLTSGLTMTGNNIAGGLVILANQSFLTGSTTALNNNIVNGAATLILSSSAVSLSNNNINDSNFNFINQFSSQSAGLGLPSANGNFIGGASHTFLLTGSVLGTGLQPSFNQNFVYGNTNTIFINASDSRVSGSNIYHNSFATGLMGNRLIVTGSSNASDLNSFGSMFVGRFNANDGIKNKASDIVFAVGTGVSGSGNIGRKTGFLIDSGSNSFFEGSVTTSGSVYGNIVTLSVASQTASMDLIQGNFFSLTLVSGSTTHLTATNIRPGQTINLLLTQPAIGTGSVSYNSTFEFPAGANYIATPVTSSKDIISLITFDSSTIYATSINNLG